MKLLTEVAFVVFAAAQWIVSAPANAQGQPQPLIDPGPVKAFTLDQVLSAPFAADLVAAKKANRVAWTLDDNGKRNIWVAEAPKFEARRLTSYLQDDGQELGQVSFTEDGNVIVYTRGGEKNSAGQSPNPTSNPAGATQAVWSIAFSGGEPRKIDDGHSPKISSQGMVAYIRDGADLSCAAERWVGEADATCRSRAESFGGVVAGRIAASVCVVARRSQFHRDLQRGGENDQLSLA